MVRIDRHNYKLSQHYALISFIAIAITIVVIFIFLRVQTIQTIETANERSYTALAVALTSTMNDFFIDYIHKMDSAKKEDSQSRALYKKLEDTLQKLMANRSIVRIKIYDRNGKVIYSTRPTQIDNLQSDNPGFVSAIKGIPTTKFIYHDSLNYFQPTIADENLVQSYVPIWDAASITPIGVFEVYADVNDQIFASAKTQLLMLLFVILTMLGLYMVLIFYIRKAEKIIDEKQRESKERQKTLEFLSAKLMASQEGEKKRISTELHEDIVQTISAIKMHLEQCIISASNEKLNVSLEVSSHIIPTLQQAIRKIRTLSNNLRPPSLDTFGLKAATNTLVSEFNSMSTKYRISVVIDVMEEKLSDEKKSILYRILKDTLKMLSLHKDSAGEIQIKLSINPTNGNLVLSIYFENIEKNYHESKSSDNCDMTDFEMMRESTILSGGEFKVYKDHSGSIKALSEWDADYVIQ